MYEPGIEMEKNFITGNAVQKKHANRVEQHMKKEWQGHPPPHYVDQVV